MERTTNLTLGHFKLPWREANFIESLRILKDRAVPGKPHIIDDRAYGRDDSFSLPAEPGDEFLEFLTCWLYNSHCMLAWLPDRLHYFVCNTAVRFFEDARNYRSIFYATLGEILPPAT